MGEFLKFKPVCVELLKTPSLKNLAKLKSLVDDCDDSSLNQLQEYILFPLFILASNSEARYSTVGFQCKSVFNYLFIFQK